MISRWEITSTKCFGGVYLSEMLSSFHQTFDEQEQDLFSTKDKAPPCLTVMKEQQNCVKQLVGIFIYLLKKNKQDYCLNIVMMMSSCLEYIEG